MDRAFSATLLFCFLVCVVTAKETRKNSVLLFEPESKVYISTNKFINKEFLINGSELMAGADECKCKNGRCMRMCDVEKTVPCLEKKKVCVCSPGFAEYNGACVDCNCGQGFNCTFKKDGRGSSLKKICFCPKGYTFFQYDSSNSYYDYCKPECSDERPCRNGGTCSYGKCDCLWGIKGDLCEEIYACGSMCENRLELNCLFNQTESLPYCTCKKSYLFYDPEVNYCKPCPCGKGVCEYSFDNYKQVLKCKCIPKYKEFRGYCKRCDCGFGFQCDFDWKGNKICKCGDGFYEREGRCLACGCMSYSDTHTKCEIIDNRKHCFCEEGFHDVLGECEDVDECEMYKPCHSSATCYNKYGSFECHCHDGYEGDSGSIVQPGEVCEDIDECKQFPDPCWHLDNVKCINLPGSYKCECFEGYEPSYYNTEPRSTSCVRPSISWGPPMIVLFISLALITITGLMHFHLKKRAARSN